MPRTGLRPHVWRSGSDPVNHRLYTDCQRARAQARYRGEEWTITEEEYVALWRQDDRYLKKGRTRESLCLTMRDPDMGWHLNNVEFITRLQHFQQCNLSKPGIPRNGRRKEKTHA